MTTILKICTVALVLVSVFLLSGYIANMVLSFTGCVWTSSSIFGVSFLAISGLIAQGIFYVTDTLNLF